ncbi:hypothetical protein [Pontiella sulfatireligans]|uniref:SLA1 homology domain-containing protein n=1 Tax=Pontiella sulfatireligans TaxID=2750658 RepID=A0A6C2UFB3_9BACT|nr:hypothetical protein [Pontiella sulfatireligans]VGO18835.1 hypothetical protein SCARR_00888 [Pontiella sulfatireligans]
MKGKHLIRIIFATVFAAGACFSQHAWQLNDGETFESEFVKVLGREALFRGADGRNVKVPLDQFSPESRRLIELEKPPELEFSFVNISDKKIFPAGINEKTQRPAEMRCLYGVKIKQRSAGKYNYELKLELFVIGQERLGDKYILLDSNEADFLLPEENGRRFEFRSDREVVLQNYTDNDDIRGEKYYGFLAIVTDERGEEVGMRASHDWLYENIGNLRNLSINNYMDDACLRTFPTRPKSTRY